MSIGFLNKRDNRVPCFPGDAGNIIQYNVNVGYDVKVGNSRDMLIAYSFVYRNHKTELSHN